jgi:indolepyruvate ferredoxin oxidoreductase alpha subunit
VHGRARRRSARLPGNGRFRRLKLVEREPARTRELRHRLPPVSILPPFNLGNTTMGYGLGGAGAARSTPPAARRAIALVGDGGCWHNGLTSSDTASGVQQIRQRTVIVDKNGLHLGEPAGRHSLHLKRQPASARRRIRREGGDAASRRVGAHADGTPTTSRALRRHVARGADHPEKGLGHRGASSECMLKQARRVASADNQASRRQ